MSRLHFALLGSPEVHHGEQVLTFSTHKALALLIYLAVEDGMHTRKALSEWFWPERDAEHGRGLLRGALQQLREALIKEHAPGERPHLIIDRDLLGLDLSSDVDLDLHTLQAAFKLAQEPLRTGHTISVDTYHKTLAQLQDATMLARGTFLAGFSLRDCQPFDDWTSIQREYWHLRLSRVFDRLFQLQEAVGEIGQAIQTLNHWITFDPLHEEAYHRLMRMQFANGDRVAALQTYDTYRTVLAQELQAVPLPEIVALAERIRTTAAPRHAVSNNPSSLLPPFVLADAPLVGRAVEFGTLIEMYQKAQRGQTQVVFLEGESGIGKTRLANVFVTWAEAQGADALRGRAFESSGRLPYQPLIDAIRPRLEREKASKYLLADVWLAELSRLLPELRERRPDLAPPEADELMASTQMFEAITRLFHALALQNPLVLFLDDMQWADTATLDLLHYLILRWAENKTPVLLLLGLRTEAPDMRSALREWRMAIGHILSLTRLTLNSLTAEDTLRLLHTLEDGKEPLKERQKAFSSSQIQVSKLASLGQWLYSETGGQPFYVMETLKALLEQGVLVLQGNDHGQWSIDLVGERFEKQALHNLLPSSVRELIRSRLDRLTPSAFALLVASAVMGQGADFEQLYQVAMLEKHEGLLALDEVLRSRLLREWSQGGERKAKGTYVFAHDKIREVVYAEAGEARRRLFHSSAFEVLQIAGVHAADLANHALLAGLLEYAFRYSVSAGDNALAVFAVRDAVIYYEQARQLLGDLTTSTSETEIQRLYVQLGRAYELVNEWELAYTMYEEMLVYARRMRQPIAECIALNRLAVLIADRSADLHAVKDLLQKAVRAARASDDKDMLEETAWNLAQLGGQAWDQAAVKALGDQAQMRIRELRTWLLVAHSLTGFTLAEARLTPWEVAEDSVEDAIALYVAQGNQEMEANCQFVLAATRLHCGKLPTAITAGRRAYALSKEIDNMLVQASSASILASGLIEVGDYVEALTMAQESVRLGRALGFLPLLAANLQILGEAHRAVFQLEKAREAYYQALKISETLIMRGDKELIMARLCATSALSQNWAEAYTYARQALTERDYSSLPLMQPPRWYETEALIRGGDVEEAQKDIQRLGERIGANRRYRIPYLRSLAALAQWSGKTEQAMEYLWDALTLAEEIHLPGEEWQLQAAFGDLYESRGEKEQGRAAIAKAAAIVRELAAKMRGDTLQREFLSAVQIMQVLEMAATS